MSIAREHIPYYQEIFALDGFIKDPILLFGFQDCSVRRRASSVRMLARRLRLWITAKRHGLPSTVIYHPVRFVPQPYNRATLQEILHYYGATSVQTLDAFDDRATFMNDMNLPVGEDLVNRFSTIIDIGSLEHVFDTRQCIENLLTMLKTGGHIFFHVPCNGYCNHGFHTFSPDCITGALESNGCVIRYMKFTSRDGFELKHPAVAAHSLLWVVAQKMEEKHTFVIPQQQGWKDLYHGN